MVEGAKLSIVERVETAREGEKWNPAEREPVEWVKKKEGRTKDTDAEEPQGTAAGLRCQIALLQLEGRPGHRREGLRTGHAAVLPYHATP